MINNFQKDRRQYLRSPFNGDVRINEKIKVEPSDISEGGLYVITERSLMLGSEFDVSLSFRDKELRIKSRVQNIQEGIGMGLMFIAETDEIKRNIKYFIEDIRTDILKRSIKNQNILLIDDDVITRKICRCKLTLEGFSVVESNGGINVADILDNQKINLIILNLHVKIMGGFKMINILKRSMKYKGIPLIAFSSNESEDIKEKVKSSGANTYLSFTAKTSADLIKAVKKILPL
jgi:CheY-like chemotaxis protein